MKIYLDNNATTRICREAAEEISSALDEFGNPSSIHSYGRAARKIIDKARSRVAAAIGAGAEKEIIFTSGGTESDNIAIAGTLKKHPGKKHIITSRIEHHAVLNIFKYYEKNGYEVSWIDPGSDGRLDTEKVIDRIGEDTALVSIMAANNETGVIQPIENIANEIKNNFPEVIFHTDAVQYFGKEKLNAAELEADLITLSGHKIHGPKGIGALYIKKGVKVDNIVFGGHHERGVRPGTENVPFIAGMGKAAEIASRELESGENYTHIKQLKEKLAEGLLKIPGEVRINGSQDNSLVNTLNISFKNIEGESIIMMLDSVGIAVSSGSACTSGSLEPSHVLSAMGIDPVIAQGSVRFSLSKFNTEEEIDYVIKQTRPIVKKLRAISPL